VTRWRLALSGCVLLLLAAGSAATAWPTGPPRVVTAARTQPLGGGPAGFWYATDSWPVPVSGRAPYSEPGTGGSYGGYIGMTGSWSYWLGCRGGFLAWSSANSAQADTNYTTYGTGIGTAVYWFMGGLAWIPVTTGPRPRPSPGGRGRRPGRWPTRRGST